MNMKLWEKKGGFMKRFCVGDKLQIQCYKHNGKIHRAWNEAIFLDETKDYIVFGNNKTMVTESGGSTWKTKEPAVMYFFKNHWFNVIVQFKKEGITYYCNIASPYIIEEGTIKYIDYDLDLRIFPNGSYKILDRMEYLYHKRIMDYSEDLDQVVNSALDELITIYKEGKLSVFYKEENMKYYNLYKKIKEEEKKGNFS